MKQLYNLLLTAAVLTASLAVTNVRAQAFPQADPAVITISKQGPSDPVPTGSNISGTAILKFRVANNSAGTIATGKIPALSVFYTVQFNPYYTYQSLVPSSQFEVFYASPGAPDYVVQLRNIVDINPGDVFDFYLNVVATQETTTPGGEIVTLNVDRFPPPACGNTTTANDNVSKSFNVISLIPLPARFIDLTAVLNHQQVDLKWTTRDELNVNSFELERSTNGRDFLAITTKPAAGNTSGTTDYTYSDNVQQLVSPVIYYRVKTIDNDGRTSYTKIVTVKLAKTTSVLVWPNPFTTQVNLQVTSVVKTKGFIKLYNSAGFEVKSQPITLAAGTNFLTVDGLGTLPKGVYMVDVRINNERIFSGKLTK